MDPMRRPRETQRWEFEMGILVLMMGRQQAVAEVAMPLLSIAFLAASDIEIFVAVVEAVVVASTGPNTVGADAVLRPQSIV
jgi:hypothetical protein